MKNIICVLALILTVTSNAQVLKNTIGLRLGYDAQEVSFQQSVFDNNRLELNLGVNTFGINLAGNPCRGVGLNAVYQYVFDVDILEEQFQWYYGFGMAVLSHGGLFGTGALGQIGLQYSFESPWLLSIDYRPGLYYLPGAGNTTRFSWNAPCIALKYKF